MPAFGAVAVGVLLAKSGEMRQCGHKLFVSLFVFAASIILFGVSTNFWLSVFALFVYGAADMVSVNIRLSLIQIATPDNLRGRVSAVNGIFISSSNEMGDVRSGALTVNRTCSNSRCWRYGWLPVLQLLEACFLKLRKLDKINDAAASR